MKTVTLIRQPNTSQGISSEVFIDGEFFCYALELPWIGNLNNISCIPAGNYSSSLTFSNTFNENLYLVKAVPARAGIRFHAGNWAGNTQLGYRTDSAGCILLGNDWLHKLGAQKMILSSRTTLEKFHEELQEADVKIEIKWLEN